MKLVVINGSPHKGNTYRLTQQFLDEMKKHGEISVQEFFMPQDMPEFCRGCCTCVIKGEDLCPHKKYVRPILDAMLDADALIFTTPVYVMSASGGMKNFLDHLPFLFLVHRPRPEMFHKKAMILSTAAGAGMKQSMKPIADCIKFWGINRIYRLGFAIMAYNWDSVPEKRRRKYDRRIQKSAKRFWRSVSRGDSAPTLFCRFMFGFCRWMHRSGKDIPVDRKYWKEQGWLDGAKPY